MFVHKYEERLKKDISTLQAEAEMLKPGGRNSLFESHEHIASEIALLKHLAATIEAWMMKRLEAATLRMECLTKSGCEAPETESSTESE